MLVIDSPVISTNYKLVTIIFNFLESSTSYSAALDSCLCIYCVDFSLVSVIVYNHVHSNTTLFELQTSDLYCGDSSLVVKCAGD